jgi:subtilisin family serine protease
MTSLFGEWRQLQKIYVYKIFPKGDFFVLGAAIEAAVADGVDLINMSLGSAKDVSNDIIENISAARNAGIACFVAAGNSANNVQFPANVSSAIAVSALGSVGTVPSDSVQVNEVNAPFVTPDGYFSPTFTCFGPSVDFTGPGVGVISTIPHNGFKVLDGTSMATPHLTGLAALYLAHDPILRSAPRDAARVDMLVQRMKRSVIGLPFGNDRVGAGLPIYSDAIAPAIAESSNDAFGPAYLVAWTPTGLRLM